MAGLGIETAATASKQEMPLPGLALRTEGLTRRFRSGGGELEIFAGLQFELMRGEMVAIVGESGTGKSSLLQLLGGLDRPTGGDVYFGTRSLAAMSEDELADFRNREIGFVWQQAYLLPEFTAEENAMMPLLARGVSAKTAAAEAQAMLTKVGLQTRTHHRAGELSGGEQQRVAMARALVGGPQVLLADEPTGNLDERTGSEIFALLRRLHQEAGMSTVVVTHNQGQARRCDRVLRLHQGRLQEEPTQGPATGPQPEAGNHV